MLRGDAGSFALADAVHEGTLSDEMRLLKGRSAHAIGLAVWQPNYYDHAVRRDENLWRLAQYIVANPLRARLVKEIGDYSLWDGVWLEGALSG